jgi:multidrug efflux pump
MDKTLGRFFAASTGLQPRFRELQPRRQGRDLAQGRDAGRLRRAGAGHRGLFKAVPGGFVPGQDKQYLIGFAQLPDGATLDRTEDVIRKISDIAMKEPGVEHAIAFPGLSINGFTNSSNSGIVFLSLKPFDSARART